MRDLKFRGWDSEHKCWRYGWLTRLCEGARRFYAIICEDGEGDLTRYYIHEEVSIGQYTGFKDKNGKEIYEGDIYNTDLKLPFQVFLKEGAFCGGVTYEESTPLGWYVGDDLKVYPSSSWVSEDIEVIGNIYENPELTKESRI